MVRFYFDNDAPVVTISWKVREKDNIPVDFTGKTVTMWLVGNGDKILVSCEASSAGVVTATVPTTLEAGVYNARVKWLEGWVCCKEEVEDAFGVVSTSGEATAGIGETYTLYFDSIISKCKYDDLTDYEKSVLRGITDKNEVAWLQASSGSYNDLSDKPTNVSDFANDVPFMVHSFGATENRPVGVHEESEEVVGQLTQDDIGFVYFDTDLGMPIFASAIDETTGEVTWLNALKGDPDE